MHARINLNEHGIMRVAVRDKAISTRTAKKKDQKKKNSEHKYDRR